ncbi:hypothetical protein [Micromonospora sp. DT41]
MTDATGATGGVEELKPGSLLLIGEECSVQFAGERALRLRLVSLGLSRQP